MDNQGIFFDENRIVLLPELYAFVPRVEFEEHRDDDSVHIDPEFRAKVDELTKYPDPDRLLLRAEMTEVRLSCFDEAEESLTSSVGGVVIGVEQFKDYLQDRGFVTDNLVDREGQRVTSPDALVDAVYNVRFKGMEAPQEDVYLVAYGIDVDGENKWLSTSYKPVYDDGDGIVGDFPRQMDFNGYDKVCFFFTDQNMYKESKFIPLAGLQELNVQLVDAPSWVECLGIETGYAPVMEFNVNPALDNIYVKQNQYTFKNIGERVEDDKVYVPQLNGVQMSKLRDLLNGQGGYIEMTGEEIGKLRDLLEHLTIGDE